MVYIIDLKSRFCISILYILLTSKLLVDNVLLLLWGY
nr:MAG TPA: hypothetical protein [Bacteriophage sp.]DAS41596.1 MAG TPA: hypothetical protein [Bacteriophage sp.]DAW53309.1 MAG TPA: hypothetical protein [Caudoviricetes sp.]